MKKIFSLVVLVVFVIFFGEKVEAFNVKIHRNTVMGSTIEEAMKWQKNTESTAGESRVRRMRSWPMTTSLKVPTSDLKAGENILYRYSVSAIKGDISIQQMSVGIKEENAKVRNINIYAFMDANFSKPMQGLSDGGKLRSSNVLAPNANGEVEVNVTTASGNVAAVVVPPNASRYFEVRGNVSDIKDGAKISTKLLGDIKAPVITGLFETAAAIKADVNNNFVWSPNTEGVSPIRLKDWTNGNEVPGLSANGLSEVSLIRTTPSNLNSIRGGSSPSKKSHQEF